MEDKINILVLEDNPDDVEFIVRCMTELGIDNSEFEVFSTRDHFLSLLGYAIHIVILDHMLDIGTGYEVFQEIRKRNAGTWTIILTGRDESEIILLYMNHDADRFVSKNDQNWQSQLKGYLMEGFIEAKKNVEWVNWLKTKTLENEQRAG